MSDFIENSVSDWFELRAQYIWTKAEIDYHLITNLLGDSFYETKPVKISRREDLGDDCWEVFRVEGEDNIFLMNPRIKDEVDF